MEPHDLESMSMDELWSIHVSVASVLTRKISAEKARLDERLSQLGVSVLHHPAKKMTSTPLFPKYRNPAEPTETWAGRGRHPRWLIAQLRSGRQLDEFRIQPSSDRGAALRDVLTLMNNGQSIPRERWLIDSEG
jgi:DNA-binding protein H-NS